MLKMFSLAVWAIFSSLSLTSQAASPALANFALQQVLGDASQIFGQYQNNQSKTATWMSRIPSDTQIIHMNIPGTHDSSTWNYSQATQDSLLPITELNGEGVYPPPFYRCQQRSFLQMLDAGIRVFDLRYAFDATNTSLVFYHSSALLSESATLNDVLFGFYTWLCDHPSEAVFLSLMYEGGTKKHASNDAAAQMAIYNAVTSPAAKHYILQTKDRLGTLGEARGKVTLLRRFDLDLLPASYTKALPGLHFSPNNWTDNGPNITIVYNQADNLTAYIEDYYEIDAPLFSKPNTTITWKYNATTKHLLEAIKPQYKNSLFWTFASSEKDVNLPPDTPQVQALGYQNVTGVNQRLVSFFKGLGKGKRVGIVMFDFFDQPGDLIQTFLSL